MICVVALIIVWVLMVFFIEFTVCRIMWFNYFWHLDMIFILFTFHMRRFIPFLWGSTVIDKMEGIIKTNDGKRIKQVCCISIKKNSLWESEIKYFLLLLWTILFTVFHQLDTALLFWHPDLLICGNEVKCFTASYWLGCLYRSLGRMIVLRQDCLQFNIQHPEICCNSPQVPLVIRTKSDSVV